jgi:hypothetical protein
MSPKYGSATVMMKAPNQYGITLVLMRCGERILGDVEALRLSPAGWRSASILKGMNRWPIPH